MTDPSAPYPTKDQGFNVPGGGGGGYHVQSQGHPGQLHQGQGQGQVRAGDQSEASIQVTFLVSTNEKSVFGQN